MERMLKLSAYVKWMALVLSFAAASALAQSSQSQGQSGQEPSQPVQPQAPAKSADDKTDNGTQDQPPASPVVAGTSYDAPVTGASQPIIGLVASRSYIVPSVYFYGQLDSNANNTAGNTTDAIIISCSRRTAD